MGSVVTKLPEPPVDGGASRRISKTGGTNYVLDSFNIIQEDPDAALAGGNILTEDDKYLAMAEFNATVWTTNETTGNG